MRWPVRAASCAVRPVSYTHLQVLGSDVQRVQVLALVLVHTLDLAVKDGIGVDDLTGDVYKRQEVQGAAELF